MLSSGSAASAKNARPGLRSDEDHRDRDHLDRARDRERDQQHGVVDLLDVGVGVGHQLTGLRPVVEREVQRLEVGDEPHAQVALDAPSRARTRRSGGCRCTTACTAPTSRIRNIQLRAAVQSAFATPWLTAAPASAGTATRADRPDQAGEDAEEHHPAVHAHRLAHQPPAGLAPRACVVHGSPRRVRHAALAHLRGHEAAVPAAPGRGGYQRPPDDPCQVFGRATWLRRTATPRRCALLGLVQHVDDLVADELLALEQLVAQRDHEVAVVVEQRVHVGLGLVEQPLDRRPRVFVGEHLADDPLRDRTRLDRLERHERAGHAERADHLRRDACRVREVAARPGARLAEEQLLGRHAAERDLHRAHELRTGARVALLVVGVREQTERVPALDDRQHFELAVLTDEVRDDRVPGFVRRDRALLFVGVLDRLLQTDLLGHLRLLDVAPVHGVAARRAAPTRAPRRRGARSSPACTRRSSPRARRGALPCRARERAPSCRGSSR